MIRYPSDAVIRWSVHPNSQGQLLHLADVPQGDECPQENEVITRPFLVDPVTKAEVPVRIVQVLPLLKERPAVLAVTVKREP